MCRTVAAITVYWTGRFTRNRNLSTAAAASRKVTIDSFLTDDVFIDTSMAAARAMRRWRRSSVDRRQEAHCAPAGSPLDDVTHSYLVLPVVCPLLW
jgi:hypothetical protein